MQCPYCSNEMQTGVITFGMRSNAVWKPNDNCGEIKKIVIKPHDLDYDEMDAAYCNVCKKMILDLGNLKKPEPLFVFMKPHDDGTLTR